MKNMTEDDKAKLLEYMKDIQTRNAITFEEMRAENIALKAEVALLRREKLLGRQMIDATEEQINRLIGDVAFRVTTVTPPAPGITRVCIHGLTEIVRERDIR